MIPASLVTAQYKETSLSRSCEESGFIVLLKGRRAKPSLRKETYFSQQLAMQLGVFLIANG